MTTNEAADRLREFLSAVVPTERTTESEAMALLDAALAHERSAGAAPPDTDVLEWLDILWRHLDDRWQAAFRSGHQKVLARLFERSAGAADVGTLREAMDAVIDADDLGVSDLSLVTEAVAAEYARLTSEPDR